MGGALGIVIAAFVLIAAAISAGLYWASGNDPTVVLMAWFVFISFLLILVVLVQKPKGGGLSGAFGGGGGGGAQAMMGAQTGYALTIATVTFFVAFLGLGVWLTLDMKPASASTPDATITGTTTPPGATSPVTTTTDAPEDNENVRLQGAPDVTGDLPEEAPDDPAREIGSELADDVKSVTDEVETRVEQAAEEISDDVDAAADEAGSAE